MGEIHSAVQVRSFPDSRFKIIRIDHCCRYPCIRTQAKVSPSAVLYLISCRICIFRRQNTGNTIYIVALGDLGAGAPQMEHLAEYTLAFFDPFPVQVLPPIKLISPAEASKYKQSSRRKRLSGTIEQYALVVLPDQEPVVYPLKSRRCHPYYEHLVHKKHVQLAIDPILDVLEDFRPVDCLCFLAVTMCAGNSRFSSSILLLI
jgi:hypothetical protein